MRVRENKNNMFICSNDNWTYLFSYDSPIAKVNNTIWSNKEEENMPLKLATTDKELADKVGHENCINGDYVNAEHLLKYNTDTEITLDLDDIVSFYKMHHKRAKDELYDLKEYGLYNVDYLKNIIDILGKDIKVYYQGEYRPLYIVNKDNEIGLVIPCRKH